MEPGKCPNCGAVVWDGKVPEIDQLVVCQTPMCWTDCSMPLTPEYRERDFERRVDKHMQAYEVDRQTAERAVPRLTQREREYPAEVERLKKRYHEKTHRDAAVDVAAPV